MVSVTAPGRPHGRVLSGHGVNCSTGGVLLTPHAHPAPLTSPPQRSTRPPDTSGNPRASQTPPARPTRDREETPMDFLRPATWQEALAAKAEHPSAVPIAGGTDVMVEINFD